MDEEMNAQNVDVKNEEIYDIVEEVHTIIDGQVYMLCEDGERESDLQQSEQLVEEILYLDDGDEEEEEREKEDEIDEDLEQSASKRLTCEICDREFDNITKRNKHIEQHFVSIECSNCLHTFVGERAYDFHISAGKCKKAIDVKCFRCNMCNETEKIFDSVETLNKHLNTEHKCVIKNERIECEQCNRTFGKLKYLRKHVREVHENATPFNCAICNKKFNRKANLVEHELIHNGKYLANCTVCGKSYRTASALKLHQRMHTGEKPYKCDICNEKSYAYNTDLKRHKRAAHGILGTPYPCTQCNKIFYEPKLLRNHTNRTHK